MSIVLIFNLHGNFVVSVVGCVVGVEEDTCSVVGWVVLAVVEEWPPASGWAVVWVVELVEDTCSVVGWVVVASVVLVWQSLLRKKKLLDSSETVEKILLLNKIGTI